MNWEAIQKAYDLIKTGVVKKIELEGVIVYAVGSIVRIDIKG